MKKLTIRIEKAHNYRCLLSYIAYFNTLMS